MDDLFEMAVHTEQDRPITAFYRHVLAYALVNAVLVAINIASGDSFWIHWVLLGWALGLGVHAYLVFFRRPAVERRAVRQSWAGEAAKE